MTRVMWQSNPSTKTKISQDCPGVTREDHRMLSSSLRRNGMNTAVRINWLSNTVLILFNYSRPARFWFCLDRPILRPGHCNCLFLIKIKIVSMYKYVDLHHLDFEVVQTVFLFTFVWINQGHTCLEIWRWPKKYRCQFTRKSTYKHLFMNKAWFHHCY